MMEDHTVYEMCRIFIEGQWVNVETEDRDRDRYISAKLIPILKE